MPDLSQYTDEELLRIAGIKTETQQKDLSSYSDDELIQIANQSKKIQPIEEKVFGVAGSIPKEEFEAGRRNIFGNIFERPGAAVRAAIQAEPGKRLEAYQRGSILPHKVPTFRELGGERLTERTIEQASRRKGLLSPTRLPGRLLTEAESATTGIIGEISGTALDIITNPADLLAMLIGKTPIGEDKTLGGVLSQTRPVEAVGRFLTKERGIPGRGVLQRINQSFKNIKNPIDFAKKVRTNLFQTKRGVGDVFEEGIKTLSEANPTKTIDLSDQIYQVKGAIADVENNPGLASEVNSVIRRIKNPQKASFVQTLIDDPENARNLTLAQVQDIKNTIQQAPSIATKLKQGKFADWKAGDLELLDLVDEIKLAQSELFPEEMALIRKPYAEYMSAYREVKNYFKPKVLLDRMRTGFGNEEIEQMVKVVLPKDIYKQIKGFRKTGKTIKWGAATIGAGTGLWGTQKILRKIIKD